MSEYNLCGLNQSAYKPNHSLETALVCIQNDLLRAMDNQTIVIMLLLDLSAAFDTVVHSVMLRRLSHDVGVVQTALVWLKSCLSEELNLSTLMVVRHLLALLRVGFIKVLYSVRICSLFMQHRPLSKIVRNNNLMSHFSSPWNPVRRTLTRLSSTLNGV